MVDLYYCELLEKDLLLPQSSESLEAKVLRIQEEHKFFAENEGRRQCWCTMCGRLDSSSAEKGGA